jgi:hypothetical protein
MKFLPNRKSDENMATASKACSILVYIALSLQVSCSYESQPASTVETTSRYDSASKMLTIGCAASSQGSCHVALESLGSRQSIHLNAGTMKTMTNVAPVARTCIITKGQDISACSWTAVAQPSR